RRERVAVAIDERQMAAVGSKLERQRRADATSGAGHDGDCVSERKPHRALPFDRGCKLATPLRRCRSPAIRVWAVGSGCRVLYAHGMSEEYLIIVVRMAVALLIGALIGFERTFHGRPAGFRTHALVSLASAILMLTTVYQGQWMTAVSLDTIRTDPTRMAQGIMTGIGFLGAGVIFKEGLTVRGLTTAASIWITAAIGMLVGVGFYFPAILAAIATLAVLAAFRVIEHKLPGEFYAHHTLKLDRGSVLPEDELRKLICGHGFTIANLSYRLAEGGKIFEYRMVIRTRDRENAENLSRHLRQLPEVKEFRIAPTGD